MRWYATSRYAFSDLDFYPVQSAFIYIPSSADRQALATAIEYFLRDEVPPEEE
jgi:hypothetical protein